MNDIEILEDMLTSRSRVPLQHDDSWFFVELEDRQAKTNVKIKNIPQHSIVVRADTFEFRHPVFAGSKDEGKRADFVIVSNENAKKWMICIEIKKGNIQRSEVTAQLRGARCVMDYCKSIGRDFWSARRFLSGYEYRFVGIVDINNINKEPTHPLQSQGKHKRPDVFLPISGRQSLYFNELI